eukprot:3469494-Pleurochrysis_carterae.AAC.1
MLPRAAQQLMLLPAKHSAAASYLRFALDLPARQHALQVKAMYAAIPLARHLMRLASSSGAENLLTACSSCWDGLRIFKNRLVGLKCYH